MLPGAVEALLPTPNAGNFNDGEDLSSWEERRQRNLAKGYNGNGQGTPLAIAAQQMFRTPTSQLAVNGGSQHPDKRKAGGHGPTLADEVEHLLPTPQANDAKGNGSQDRLEGRPGGGNFAAGNLRDRVHELLPTPSVTNSHGNETRSDGSLLLPGVAKALLPTPNATDWKGSGATQGRIRDGRERPPGDVDLSEAVTALLPTPMTINRTSDKAKTGRPTSGPQRGGPSYGLEDVLLPTPNATDGQGGIRAVPEKRTHSGPDHGPRLRDAVPALLPTPQVADVTGGHRSRSGDRSDEPLLPAVAEQIGGGLEWGPYAFAVDRWADVTGIDPPAPVKPGKTGMRLAEEFVEWMQGLPPGWVTAVPGLSRNAKLKALGNGVVPLQALMALAIMRRRVRVARRVSRLWLMR